MRNQKPRVCLQGFPVSTLTLLRVKTKVMSQWMEKKQEADVAVNR